MPDTLYSLGKAASLDGADSAQAAWTRLLTSEKDTALAAQAHFALAKLSRKSGKSAQTAQAMQEFRRLQPAVPKQPAPDLGCQSWVNVCLCGLAFFALVAEAAAFYQVEEFFSQILGVVAGALQGLRHQ